MVASLPLMRRLMLSSVGASVAATLGAIGWAWTAPVPSLPAPQKPRPTETAADEPTPHKQVDLKAAYWSKRLQRPTIDPPPVVTTPKPVAPTVVAPPKPPPTLPNVELLGTIIDSEQTYGIFQIGSGQTAASTLVETLKPGDKLPGPNKGAELVSVTDNQAVVKYQGQEFTLKVKDVTPKKGPMP